MSPLILFSIVKALCCHIECMKMSVNGYCLVEMMRSRHHKVHWLHRWRMTSIVFMLTLKVCSWNTKICFSALKHAASLKHSLMHRYVLDWTTTSWWQVGICCWRQNPDWEAALYVTAVVKSQNLSVVILCICKGISWQRNLCKCIIPCYCSVQRVHYCQQAAAVCPQSLQQYVIVQWHWCILHMLKLVAA